MMNSSGRSATIFHNWEVYKHLTIRNKLSYRSVTIENIYENKRTTLADFYYLLPANILCNHACLIKWKNGAIAKCKICNALETNWKLLSVY